ncbi:hypothetical protein [Actinophytocola sp. NPDC049390]|uniref:hypothetical protein n=1 Tax=Actinophytocola sp. NPDC049390 TaxID=3363894 RepID=UPI0037B7ABAD
MVCDIHTHVEQQDSDGTWRRVEWPGAERHGSGPFDWSNYGLFAFFAGVRNYSAVPPLAEPRGLPADVSSSLLAESRDTDFHSHSWLSVAELAGFDYAQTFEDRREGGMTVARGVRTTYRAFLGAEFFRTLAALSSMNAVRPTRLVFWFDN